MECQGKCQYQYQDQKSSKIIKNHQNHQGSSAGSSFILIEPAPEFK
jgi:hypothetical protein